MSLTPISPVSVNTIGNIGAAVQKPASGTATAATESFGKILDALNQSQQNADGLSQDLATGGNTDLHTVMIGLEENDVNFRVAIAMRDKLVDAYQQVTRMQI